MSIQTALCWCSKCIDALNVVIGLIKWHCYRNVVLPSFLLFAAHTFDWWRKMQLACSELYMYRTACQYCPGVCWQDCMVCSSETSWICCYCIPSVMTGVFARCLRCPQVIHICALAMAVHIGSAEMNCWHATLVTLQHWHCVRAIIKASMFGWWCCHCGQPAGSWCTNLHIESKDHILSHGNLWTLGRLG